MRNLWNIIKDELTLIIVKTDFNLSSAICKIIGREWVYVCMNLASHFNGIHFCNENFIFLVA